MDVSKLFLTLRSTISLTENETQEDETEPRSVDTSGGSEGKLLDGVTLNLPSLSESNVTHADGHPGENGGQTRKSQEPIKDLTTVSGDVHVGNGSEDQDGDDRGQRSTGLVNVGEDSGSETGLGESGQGSRSGVDTRETDREDGDTDGGVDQVVETLDVGVGKDQNERRSLGVVTRGPGEKSLVIVGDQQSDQGQGRNVDQGDSRRKMFRLSVPHAMADVRSAHHSPPESLLDSGRHGLSRVGGLGGGQTDELGSSEREGGGDEHSADTLETGSKGTGVRVVSSTDVAVVSGTGRSTSTDEDDTSDQEDDSDRKLEARRPDCGGGRR